MYRAFYFFIFACHALCAQHKCGNDYFTSLKRLQTIKKTFDTLKFLPGDTVASIGASNGWFEAALSVYYNGLTFYLEDVDTACLNSQNLQKQLDLYAGLKKSSFKNNFIQVTGTSTSTNLPNATFQKVLINDVYHHFENKAAMLSEIKRICRPGAELNVIEPIGAPTKNCNYYKNSLTLISEFETAGYKLVSQTEVIGGTFLFKFICK